MYTRAFERVVVIMFENQYRNYVRRNPYMRALASKGISMNSYFGVMHPSNTNYMASVAGEICNVTEDPVFYTLIPTPYPNNPGPAPFDKETIVDRLRAKGLGWKAYLDGYAPIDFPPQLAPVMSASDPTKVDSVATAHKTILDYPPYLNMHNPFVRFQSIVGDADQWGRLGTIYDFYRDALGGTLPEYSWITPDIWSDGHWLWGSYDEPGQRAPVLVDQAAKWLEGFFGVLDFPGKRSRLPKGTLVVVTYDEADYEQSYETVEQVDDAYDGPNQIYTVLLGDRLEPASIELDGYNHYSLLRTIEQNFGLGTLGKNDSDANWFRFLWAEHFAWGEAEKTPISSADFVAAAGLGAKLFVVYGDDTSVRSLTFRGKWSTETVVPAPAGTTAVELAACGDQLVLVCQTAEGLSALTFNGVWSEPQTIVSAATGAFALTAYTDYGDKSAKVMLAFSNGGAIQSQIYASGAWGAAVDVKQQTDGDIALAALGASLLLICKAPGTNGMNVVSYNTGDFNVVTSSKAQNDTNRDAWAPTAFPVAFFATGPNPDPSRGELEPLMRPYEAGAPLAVATLDGVVHLAHPGVDTPGVVTETFSLSGVLTPVNPVSYSQQDAATCCNGYGTLAQAGWSRQVRIPRVKASGAMAMARFNEQLALLFQHRAGGSLRMVLGGYSKG